jgi:hypothetical protein
MFIAYNKDLYSISAQRQGNKDYKDSPGCKSPSLPNSTTVALENEV